MIRALKNTLNLPRNPNLNATISPSLTNPRNHFSTTRRRRKTDPKSPPPPDQSQISAAISTLPPRFSSADLSAAINRISNPLLFLPLLHFSLHRPNVFISSSSPFLIAIQRLGSSRLYREMDSIASLAFSLPSLPLPEKFFNALIRFYSEARWISKAIGAYKIMISSRSAANPTARTYDLLFAAILGHRGANSYVHHLYMDPLRSLFRQMEGFGVAPEIRALNSMIKGYVMSLHVNDALRMFHQMVPVYGVEPDEHTYSYLVHGLCSQGRTRNAKEIFGEMRGRGFVGTWRAWNSLVSALAMAGEVEEAVGAMWEGVGFKRCPDFLTCRTVVEEICRRESVSVAVMLVREMKRKEAIGRECYEELIGGLEEEYGD